MYKKETTKPQPPKPPPQPLPLPPRHCRWIPLEQRCAPNEQMLDYTATGPDGNQYRLCCDINRLRRTVPGPLPPVPPPPPTPRAAECVPPERKCPDGTCVHEDLRCLPVPIGSFAARPRPTLAARARPTTRHARRAHKRALWRGLSRAPVPTTPRTVLPPAIPLPEDITGGPGPCGWYAYACGTTEHGGVMCCPYNP